MDIGASPAPGLGTASLPDRLEKYGRYFLVDRLATGGMAEVYRAVTRGVEGFRRTFVVKRILSEKATSPTFIKMFCDEARVSALLNHPNIVQVYDFGHVGGTYFLAMEYLVGKDGTRLRSGYFKAGEQTGEWTTYDAKGRVYKVTRMKP